MNQQPLQSIRDHLRDLRGFCRVHEDSFADADPMRDVFGEICRILDHVEEDIDTLNDFQSQPEAQGCAPQLKGV